MLVANSTEGWAAPCLDAFEAGFDRIRKVAPQATDALDDIHLTRALTYRIRRQPVDLLAHVQRINLLCSSLAGSARIYAAARDLFDTLGENGVALRKRIADQVAPLLEPDQRKSLLTSASKAAAAQEQLTVVIPIDHRTAAETDPVSYADELLCAGDYAEAALVLEAMLPKDPASNAIAALLQSIYRSARDAEAYNRSRQIVLNESPDAAAAWPEAEVFFGGS
jgi:hypothetical protein